MGDKDMLSKVFQEVWALCKKHCLSTSKTTWEEFVSDQNALYAKYNGKGIDELLLREMVTSLIMYRQREEKNGEI